MTDVLSEDYHWPMNMDSREYGMDFISKFVPAAKAKGLKFIHEA